MARQQLGPNDTNGETAQLETVVMDPATIMKSGQEHEAEAHGIESGAQ